MLFKKSFNVKSFFLVFLVIILFGGITIYQKLKNHPNQKIENFVRRGTPPNQYNKRFAELSKNPSTGYPTTEKKYKVQDSLIQLRRLNKEKERDISKAVSGENQNDPWFSIGPSNVGGRTRAAIFDLSDSEYKKVIAGGVSGGLWRLNDITDTINGEWEQIVGVPGNLAVSSLTQSKERTNLIFAGTGESYTGDDAKGNGIYRSEDGGLTWEKVFGIDFSEIEVNEDFVEGLFYVNDLELWTDPIDGKEYLISALGDSNESPYIYDFISKGLYVSPDYGETWNKIELPGYNNPYESKTLNDIEIDNNNKVWISTTRSGNGQPGGSFFYSQDLTSFTEISPYYPEIDNNEINRVEFAASKNTEGLFYILISTYEGAEVYKTNDSFNTLEKLIEPIDLQTGIPSYDFTRGQSFYDLEIEIDPTNDAIVYAGGVNLFRTDDGGSSWTQLSKWWGEIIESDKDIPVIHADQHGLVFKPSNSNEGVILNDGGVYYGEALSDSLTTPKFHIQEKNYVTSQFYEATQSPVNYPIDYILGGTQDNGTQMVENINLSTKEFFRFYGGDGGHSYFDQVNSKYVISNYIYNKQIYRLNLETGVKNYINNEDNEEGDFINPGALDSNLDILYTNGSVGDNYRIRRFFDLDLDQQDYNSDYINNLPSNPTTFRVSPFNSESTALYVGFESGQIIKYTNANSNAVPITLFESLGSVSDISFGDTEDELYVTYYNYGINNIFFSFDGGENWYPMDGNLPDIPVTSIQYNPFQSGEVIIGTELGIWKTKNFNEEDPEWEQVINGMSDVRVTDIEFRGDSIENNRLLVSTYGRGLFVGSFSGNETCNILLNMTGDWTIIGNDSYGDGWNNARIEILSEGNVIGTFTLEESEGFGPKTKFYNFSEQYVNLSFRYVPGDWDEEISFEIFSPSGFKIISLNESDSKYWGLLNLDACNDLDSDGVKDYKDYCQNTSSGVSVNPNGCEIFSLPEDVFSVSATSNTCIDSDNGSIRLSSTDTNYNYLYSIDGSDPKPVEGEVSIAGLGVGSYNVCFTVDGVVNYERCYTVSVGEPDPLEVSSVVNFNDRSLDLNLRGSKSYQVLLNGKELTTDDSRISLFLQSGKNTIEVKGEQDCQGIYFEEIFVSEEVKVYPNPTNGPLQLYVSGMDSSVEVSITSINGAVVQTTNRNVPMNRVLDLDLTNLNSGTYIVSIKGPTVQVHQKVIKR